MADAAALITQSASHTETAHALWDDALAQELLGLSEWDNASNTGHEFGGTTDDGNEWRVHLDREVQP